HQRAEAPALPAAGAGNERRLDGAHQRAEAPALPAAGAGNERRLDGAHQRAEAPAAPAPGAGMSVQAVLFDVDFTIARPGPELGPEGYKRLGARFGLELDPARYDDARVAAVADLKRHPELDHDEEIW